MENSRLNIRIVERLTPELGRSFSPGALKIPSSSQRFLFLYFFLLFRFSLSPHREICDNVTSSLSLRPSATESTLNMYIQNASELFFVRYSFENGGQVSLNVNGTRRFKPNAVYKASRQALQPTELLGHVFFSPQKSFEYQFSLTLTFYFIFFLLPALAPRPERKGVKNSRNETLRGLVPCFA